MALGIGIRERPPLVLERGGGGVWGAAWEDGWKVLGVTGVEVEEVVGELEEEEMVEVEVVLLEEVVCDIEQEAVVVEEVVEVVEVVVVEEAVAVVELVVVEEVVAMVEVLVRETVVDVIEVELEVVRVVMSVSGVAVAVRVVGTHVMTVVFMGWCVLCGWWVEGGGADWAVRSLLHAHTR